MVKKKPKAGRPSGYKPEYCQLVIEHMKSGKSIAAFAAAVGVSRETIWKWGKAHPEFRNACEVAKDTAQIWFETLALLIATGQHKIHVDLKGQKPYANANPSMVMFLMSRRFSDYQDPSAKAMAGISDNPFDDDDELEDDEDLLDKEIEKEVQRRNARKSRRKEKTAEKA